MNTAQQIRRMIRTCKLCSPRLDEGVAFDRDGNQVNLPEAARRVCARYIECALAFAQYRYPDGSEITYKGSSALGRFELKASEDAEDADQIDIDAAQLIVMPELDFGRAMEGI